MQPGSSVFSKAYLSCAVTYRERNAGTDTEGKPGTDVHGAREPSRPIAMAR
jgi:hypothetical protein